MTAPLPRAPLWRASCWVYYVSSTAMLSICMFTDGYQLALERSGEQGSIADLLKWNLLGFVIGVCGWLAAKFLAYLSSRAVEVGPMVGVTVLPFQPRRPSLPALPAHHSEPVLTGTVSHWRNQS
jgi:hypothetical protein